MKVVLAIVLLGCAAYAHADCAGLEAFKVKHQWQEAFGEGHHRLEFGLKLWNNIFHDHPTARDLFKRVRGDNTYSPEFEAHAQRVLSGLDMTISLLDDPDAFKAQIAHLHGQHQERNIKPEYYDFFRAALLETLPEYLGTSLDFDAWTHCYDHIVSGIK